MIIFEDVRCTEYTKPGHPERAARILESIPYLKARHPDWHWKIPSPASMEEILAVHEEPYLARFDLAADFDADTAWFPGIFDHARRSAGAAVAVAKSALSGEKAFSLMRPPGHHALAGNAMGFCYLNSVVIAARSVLAMGAKRVAIWDFDAHHGNGTEALVAGDERIRFASVHQLPGWPGSGGASFANVRNYPVPPDSPREAHLQKLRTSLDDLLDFRPDLLLVSAGFDAFVDDPITEMTLLKEDFATLGTWLAQVDCPAGAILEGGYSDTLPQLIETFLAAWDAGPAHS